MLFSPAAQTATTPHERQSVMEAYAGEVSPMQCFEADLQVVRTSPAGGEISLSASRWALTEAAIVADIVAAVEEDLDSGDDFSDGADDAPDLHFSDGADDFELHNGQGEEAGGSLLQAFSEARGHSSSTQLAVVNTEEAGLSGGPLATVDSSLIAYQATVDSSMLQNMQQMWSRALDISNAAVLWQKQGGTRRAWTASARGSFAPSTRRPMACLVLRIPPTRF